MLPPVSFTAWIIQEKFSCCSVKAPGKALSAPAWALKRPLEFDGLCDNFDVETRL